MCTIEESDEFVEKFFDGNKELVSLYLYVQEEMIYVPFLAKNKTTLPLLYSK